MVYLVEANIEAINMAKLFLHLTTLHSRLTTTKKKKLCQSIKKGFGLVRPLGKIPISYKKIAGTQVQLQQ